MAAVVLFLIISFAIWGIGDIFRGYGRTTVARIGSTEIGSEQFRQLYNERLQQLGRQLGRPLTPEQARALGLDRQLLSQLLAEAALDERARALGLGISEAEVVRRIMEEPAFRGPTGQFDQSRFEQLIRQAGYTEQRFLAEQRQYILRRQLGSALAGDINPPKTAGEVLARFENEQRSIEYIVLGPGQAGDLPPPSPDVLANYFAERKTLFRAPEYRKVILLALTPEALANTLEVSAGDVKGAYEKNIARYTVPEKREIQQIVFPSVEEARHAAERMGSGLSFDALAKERGLSEKDISLGLVAKSDMVDPAVAEVAFSLPAGAVSNAISGRFGGVIVRVTKIEPGRTRPFEEVESELKRELSLERARAEVAALRDKIEDELAAGLRLDEVAQKLALSARSIEAIDRAGRGPDGQPIGDLPKDVDVIAAIFATDVGVENDALRLPGGGYLWYDVVGITPSRERSLEEVKDQVEARWREDEIVARLTAKAKDLEDKAKAGTPLADLAAAERLKVESATGIKRGDENQVLSTEAVALIFRTSQGGIGSAAGKEPTERIVFRVTGVEVPAYDTNSPEAKRIADLLRGTLADELLTQYVARVQSDLGVSINQSALNQALGGASY